MREAEEVAPESKYVISVRDLDISYSLGDKQFMKACQDVRFDITPGESVGLLGESGAGKSTVAYALMGLIEPPNKVTGEIKCCSRDVLKLKQANLRRYRWNDIAMIFQAAMNSLDPIVTIGKNMMELILDKGAVSKKREGKKLALSLLESVDLSENVYNMYPFELSGGMKQRVIIAMSLVTNPKVLILDEPTTALDTITQFSVLSTIKSLKEEKRIGTILLISHDISVQAFMADRIIVMLKGFIVEDAPVKEILESPKHPYTQILSGQLKMQPSKAETKKSDALMLSLGCPFVPHCPYAMSKCKEKMPRLVLISERHRVACYLYGE